MPVLLSPACHTNHVIYLLVPIPCESHAYPLNNSLQLPGIAEGILDDHLAHVLLLLLVARLLRRGEEDVAVLDRPAAGAREFDHGALGVEEEERLGRG